MKNLKIGIFFFLFILLALPVNAKVSGDKIVYVNKPVNSFSVSSVNPDDVVAASLFVGGSDKLLITDKLVNKGVVVKSVSPDFITIVGKRGVVSSLSDVSGVKRVFLSEGVFRTLASNGDISIGAPVWWDAGFNGSPVTVAVIDTGIRVSHEALNTSPDRFVQKSFVSGEDEGDYNGHGTHVTGIIASVIDAVKGVAFGVMKLINAKGLDLTGSGYDSDLMSALDWAANNETTNASVLSNSWGSDVTLPDANSTISLYVDSLADEYNKTLVFAAGNDGLDNNYVSVPGDAYNVITVGAVDDKGTPDRSDDVIAGFSSQGYALTFYYFNETTGSSVYILRHKLDIVAPGVNIDSSCNDSDTSYCVKSGTSMAVPYVSAAAALLTQYGLSPLEVKALLINGAEDLGNASWDSEYGWGYLDLNKSYQLRDSVVNGSISSAPLLYLGNVSPDDKATLVWNRHVNLSSNAVSFNDLDLYLYNYSNNLWLDSSIYSVNNVEQVVSNDSSQVLVEVYPYDVSGVERFALSLPNNFSPVSLPNVTVSLINRSALISGDNVVVTAMINNTGGVKAFYNLNYVSTDSLSLINGSPHGVIEPDSSVDVNYNLSVGSGVNYFNVSVYNYIAGIHSTVNDSLSYVNPYKPVISVLNAGVLQQGLPNGFLINVNDLVGVGFINASVSNSSMSFNVNPVHLFDITGYYYYFVNTPVNLSDGVYNLTVSANSTGVPSDVAVVNTSFTVGDDLVLSDVSLNPGNSLTVGDDLTVSFNLSNYNDSKVGCSISRIMSDSINTSYSTNVSVINGSNSFVIDSGNFTEGLYLFGLSASSVNGSPYFSLIYVSNPSAPQPSIPSVPVYSGGSSFSSLIGSVVDSVIDDNESDGDSNNSLNLSIDIDDLLVNLTSIIPDLISGGLPNLTVINDSLPSNMRVVFEGNLSVNPVNESFIHSPEIDSNVIVNDGVVVKARRSVLTVTDESTNQSVNVTLITNTITNPLSNPIANLTFVVEIPKSYANSVSELSFTNSSNLIVIEDDPVVAWVFDELPAGAEATVSYVVKKDLSSVSDEPLSTVLSSVVKDDGVIVEQSSETVEDSPVFHITGDSVIDSSVIDSVSSSGNNLIPLLFFGSLLLIIILSSLGEIKRF